MVRTVSDDPQVLAAAFTHERIGNFVSVLINGARADKTVRLVADGVPAQLSALSRSVVGFEATFDWTFDSAFAWVSSAVSWFVRPSTC
jgi:hypothetical protein